MWIDVYTGEPMAFEKVVDALEQADVVYLGERHTVARHHQLQQQIVEALAQRGKRVLLGLEQMEVFNQPQLDRYNRGELDFDGLAEATNWQQRWSNFADYRGVIEAARNHGGNVTALNARAEIVRAVGRGGLEGLTSEQRAQLPRMMDFSTEDYERVTKLRMQVHRSMKPEMLNSVYQAQVVRDETMAATTAGLLRRRQPQDVVVVLLGAGHCSFGLGTPERVRRRVPDVVELIVHFSVSGDLVLSERMQAMARSVEITHQQLRFLRRPVADFLHVVETR